MKDKLILLAVNKPSGVVCSEKSQGGDVSIIDFLHYPKRITYAGRLDKDSEGLLLMTNNGDIINQMMRAANYHEKEYEVTVDKEFNDRFLKDMAAGVHLKELEVTTRPCEVERLGKKKFKIILTQGLNRQIRRMCEYLGYQVLSLKRVRIMELTIDGLIEGGYREATREEWKKLERGIADSSQLPAARRQDSAPVFSRKQGRDSISFSSFPEEKGQNKRAASHTISEKQQSVSQR